VTYQPSPLVPSMVLVSWNQTHYRASEWVKSLNLGLTGCKPFLPRPERARLAAGVQIAIAPEARSQNRAPAPHGSCPSWAATRYVL